MGTVRLIVLCDTDSSNTNCNNIAQRQTTCFKKSELVTTISSKKAMSRECFCSTAFIAAYKIAEILESRMRGAYSKLVPYVFTE